MKISNHSNSKRFGFRSMAVLCALLLVAATLPMYAVSAVATSLYEGWYQLGSGDIAYDSATHAITLNGMNTAQHLYLNHKNSSADNNHQFGSDAMTDFVIEMDVSISNYVNKDLVDQNPTGNITQAGGAFSLVFAGDSDSRLDYECVTYRVDPVNLGIMWRGYSNIQSPYDTTWGYVCDPTPYQWHWRFLSPDIFHIKATRSGSTVSMTVTDNNGNAVKDTITATLPDSIPAAGYVGLLVENATATVSNVKITNNSDAENPVYDEFFAPPSVAVGGAYEGWQLVAPLGSTPNATYNSANHTINVDGMYGVQYLYLNRWDLDNVNSSEANTNQFNPLTMTDFIIEFDAAVTNYGGKADVDAGNNGAGYGTFGLAFQGAYAHTLNESAITAKIGYWQAGLHYAGYPETTPPAIDASGYIGNSHDWHWLFNDGGTRHIKVTKSGNTITMDVNNGYVTRTATLPEGIPTTGYVGLVMENTAVSISNMKVTNTTNAAKSVYDEFFTAPTVNDGGNYEGWKLITDLNTAGNVSVDNESQAVSINGMTAPQYLYLNRWDVDDINSSAANITSFSPFTMTDFTVEFDAAVSDYLGKAAVDSGDAAAGNGYFGLTFLGANADTMANSVITAKLQYAQAGLYYGGYVGVTDVTPDAAGYIGGHADWHWRFNDGGLRHIKVTKVGNVITMDVDNGYISYTYTLPNSLPTTGFIGLVADGTTVKVSNVKVTNGNTNASGVFFHAHDWQWNGTCACGAVLPKLIEFQGTSLNEAGNSLRFGFTLKANGITRDGYVRNLTNATVALDGKNYTLVDFGAIVSNKAGAQLSMDGVDGRFTKNIPAVKLYNLQDNTAYYACGVKNIPANKTDATIYARAYYIFNDGTRDFVIYGDSYEQSIDGHLSL